MQTPPFFQGGQVLDVIEDKVIVGAPPDALYGLFSGAIKGDPQFMQALVVSQPPGSIPVQEGAVTGYEG
jgi:hypothetical protein